MIINVNEHPEYIFGAITDGNPSHAFTHTGLSGYPDGQKSIGVRIRFLSNSKKVFVKATADIIPVNAYFGHLLVNGISFTISKNRSLVRIDCASLRGSDQILLYQNTSSDTLEYEIYCPALNTLKSMEIIVDDKSEILPDNNFASSSPIIYLGSANTTGRGCTAANTTFTDIVAKRFNSNYYNLSIYNNTYLETEYVKTVSSTVADTPPWLVVCEICTHSTTPDYLKKQLESYLQTLSNCFTNSCIVLFSQPYTGGAPDSYNEKSEFCRNTIKKICSDDIVQNKKICYIDGKTVFDEISYDRISLSSYMINDYGNIILANRIISVAEGFSYLQASQNN